jgi:uncharacterized protein
VSDTVINQTKTAMEKGEKEYKSGLAEAMKKKADLAKAFQLLMTAHEKGFVKASYTIGTWYLFGKYVKLNYKTAVDFLSQAAEQKLPDASFNLAICYETGTGIKKNLKMAAALYLSAALYGEKDAMVALGRFYQHGLGVEKNKLFADIWLDRAAELGATW